MMLKTPMIWAACALVAGFARTSHGQGTLRTVTFDGPPPIAGGDDIGIVEYLELGMKFTPISLPYHLGRTGGAIPGFPVNGTAYLHAPFGDSLSLVSQSGARFGLMSVDLAEYSTVVPNAVTVHFVGYRHDGATVTQEFTTDGIIDGSGPLADFQAFYFDSRFDDVVRVEIPTYGWSLDNLRISLNVPEPSAPLVLLGFALWRVFRRPRTIRVVRVIRDYTEPPLRVHEE